ncbi:acyltransferase family protein [Niallia endozanthoxylica]|nr:acyltransferase family protein [Niallia endozanthoxylica]
MNNRIQWIDASKGIGIFLVVIGHTMLQGELRGQIYAFHMPLFFFMSGFLFSNRKYPQLKGFVQAKAKSLLIPYVSFSIISILLMKMFEIEVIDIPSLIQTFLLSERNGIYFNQPLWFLTSLFTIEIIFYLLVKYVKKTSFIMLLTMAISLFSATVLDAAAGTNTLTWSFDQSLYFIFYFSMGYALKTSKALTGSLKRSPLLIGASMLYIFFLIDDRIYKKIFQVAMGETWQVYDYFFLYLYHIVWAVIAIFFVIYLSQFLSLAVLEYLGKNSLILLALHVSLGFNLINHVGAVELQTLISNPNLLGLAYTILTIILLIPVIFILNTFFPIVLGKTGKSHPKKQGLSTIKHKKIV